MKAETVIGNRWSRLRYAYGAAGSGPAFATLTAWQASGGTVIGFR